MPAGTKTSPSRNAAAVAFLFRVWSGFYDLAVPQRLFYRRVHRRVLARWRPRAGERVLDVGCGTGLFLGELAAGHPSLALAGVDLSRPMLRRARANTGGAVGLAQGSVFALPFRGGSFDVALNTISSHFYLDPVAAFREVARVLAPGGRFFCAALTSPIARPITVGPAVYHPRARVAAHLAAAGFAVTSDERIFPATTLFAAQVGSGG
jgi:ubiquinone/menaquinone biosynthesis C-methylase UbiE